MGDIVGFDAESFVPSVGLVGCAEFGMGEWMVVGMLVGFSGVVALVLFGELVARECLLDTAWAECDGMVVAGEMAIVLVAFILNELAVAVAVVLQEVGHAGDWTVAGVNRARAVLVKADVAFGVLNVAVLAWVTNVAGVQIERRGGASKEMLVAVELDGRASDGDVDGFCDSVRD